MQTLPLEIRLKHGEETQTNQTRKLQKSKLCDSTLSQAQNLRQKPNVKARIGLIQARK